MSYKYEFTKEIKKEALANQIPITASKKQEGQLPFKYIILKRHFVERLNERLLKNVTEIDEIKWISGQIMKNRAKHYFTFSKKRPNHFMVSTKIGNIPVQVILIYDKEKDIYFGITLFIELSEKEWEQLIKKHKVEVAEKKFEKELEQKSSRFNEALNSLPEKEKHTKSNVKWINKSHLKLDEYETQKWLDSLEELPPVEKPKTYNSKKPSAPKPKFEKSYVVNSFDASSLFDAAEMFDGQFKTELLDDEEFDDMFEDNSFDEHLGLDISADDFPWDDEE